MGSSTQSNFVEMRSAHSLIWPTERVKFKMDLGTERVPKGRRPSRGPMGQHETVRMATVDTRISTAFPLLTDRSLSLLSVSEQVSSKATGNDMAVDSHQSC